VRVSADRVFELARHLTWRDREIATCLYDHQVLSTDQLRLLFFTSRRRCQDRLLFLYRHRVLDRFYPPSPFGSGKPQAHWLLDEAGAILAAASLGVEPKQLGWSRREDWSSHRQLAHRLEANQFVCELIAATLPNPHMGVTAWESTRRAAERIDSQRLVRPDAGIILDVPAGPIECFLEWTVPPRPRNAFRRRSSTTSSPRPDCTTLRRCAACCSLCPARAGSERCAAPTRRLSPSANATVRTAPWSTSTVAGRCSPRPRPRCTTRGR
jgi:hypothetical protein